VPTLFDQLLGPWELVSYQLELDAGGIVHPLGEDAVGLILYTPQRRMCVNIMRPGRTTWASPNPAAGTESEIAAAAAGYLAYGGSFTVDEASSVVEHHVDVSLFPNWIGDVQKRFVELRGDELVLESPVITDAAGTSVIPRLRWRRLA
jgi:Lipocalin-like domain